MTRINNRETEHITKDVLKCCGCGCERIEIPDKEYEEQSECPQCGDQMMGWMWNGWKEHEAREMYWEMKTLQRKIDEMTQVSQTYQSERHFTQEERTVGPGVEITKYGQEVPWMTPFGVGMIKVWGMRRRGGVVEYGVGDRTMPIQAWVTKDAFYKEWPK